ncbi:MAG: response regulator [Bacteroidales bacterium]|nr:response regulator [Bacteroidales bacterium]
MIYIIGQILGNNMSNAPLILLVDDVPQNIQVLGNILKNQGYSFALTTNGSETYDLLSRKLPDIILLDIMLPDEDGFSICKKLKDNKRTANIPIIFLSAKDDLQDKIKGFELGASDYITKPFEDIEVIERVKNHLQAKLDRDKIEKYNYELEQIVEQRTKELIKKERENILAQFMQGIIHNVRGPISSVANGLQLIDLMKNDIVDQSGTNKKISDISDHLDEIWEINSLNTEKMKSLLSDLDSMLRKSRDDHSQEIATIDLNKLIEQELSFLQVDLDFKNLVEKDIQLYSKPIYIKVVPAEISQIFQNLIKNAMDALYNQQSKIITIKTGLNKQGCYFSIADNGPGIPKDIIELIFDPFFTTKPKEVTDGSHTPTGTGIGLQFCKNTAKSYGGNIRVDEKTKIGASFIVNLPIEEV